MTRPGALRVWRDDSSGHALAMPRPPERAEEAGGGGAHLPRGLSYLDGPFELHVLDSRRYRARVVYGRYAVSEFRSRRGLAGGFPAGEAVCVRGRPVHPPGQPKDRLYLGRVGLGCRHEPYVGFPLRRAAGRVEGAEVGAGGLGETGLDSGCGLPARTTNGEHPSEGRAHHSASGAQDGGGCLLSHTPQAHVPDLRLRCRGWSRNRRQETTRWRWREVPRCSDRRATPMTGCRADAISTGVHRAVSDPRTVRFAARISATVVVKMLSPTCSWGRSLAPR